MELSKTNSIVGMQDMGAAGIICSTSEMSAAGNCGMEINLDKVPLRQKNMEPYEILLSESQERMLVVVQKGKEESVKKIFKKWDLNCKKIGVVTKNKDVVFYSKNKKVAQIPAESLVLGGGAPIYQREYNVPEYFSIFKKFDINTVTIPENIIEYAYKLISLPNIASKNWIYKQYDSMVGTVNMTTNSPSDAAVVNLKGSKIALALTVDCNARYVNADPEIGTQIAVAECARNIVCSGGDPAAITNCLNFGNPYDKEVYWQFVSAIKGMTKACKKFKTPVTGGNVSFYNQTKKGDIVQPCFPTPTIGMVGIIKDKNNLMSLDFKQTDDLIYLLGPSKDDISSSEYLVNILNIHNSSTPFFDLDLEFKLHQIILKLIEQKTIKSAHDISDGGLFVSLIESMIPRRLGCEIYTDPNFRQDAYLFGESQSRVLVSLGKKQEKEFISLLHKNKFPYYRLGKVVLDKVLIDDVDFGNIQKLELIYSNSLGKNFK
jgi:phosphoribosylformylglycinamidine synthase